MLSTNDRHDQMPTTDSHGPSTTYNYDAMGKLLQTTRSIGGTSQLTTYQYDVRDRLVSITDALNRTTTFQYDPIRVIEKPKSITDPAGRVTYFEYDKRQRLVKKTEANGAVTRFTYDQRSNLTSVTDAQGGVTTYSYDLNDRKIREMRQSVAGSSAAQRVTLYFYDAADHLVREVTKSATGGQDRAIVYEYDSLDRMVRKLIQREGSVTVVEDESLFTYENQLDASLLKSAVNGVANLGFTNEAAPPFASSGFSVAASQGGNPLGLITGDFSITRDVTGEIASVAKDGAVLFTRGFDAAGRLTNVTTPGGFSTSIGYDGLGRKSSVVHSTGESGSFQRDLLDRLVSVQWTGPTPISETLNWDLAGNIISLQRENGNYTLSHDAVDQIVSSATTGSANYNRSWGYSPVGDRLNDSQNGPGTFINHFLVANGISNFLADPDGFGDVVRETSGAVVKNFGYRGDGLLNALQSGTTQAAYYFDALSRRVAKVINQGGQSFTQSYVHLGKEDRILQAKAGDGSITTYLDGLGVDEHFAEQKNGIGKGYVSDRLGSVLNGESAGYAHRFGIYGEVLGTPPALSPTSSPVMHGWQGLSYEAESSNWDNHARQYSPNTGTFLSQDPSGIDGGFNVYRSRLNNPQRYFDPNGLDVWEENSEAIGGIHRRVGVDTPNGPYGQGFGRNDDNPNAGNFDFAYDQSPGSGKAGSGIVYSDTADGTVKEVRRFKSSPDEDALVENYLKNQVNGSEGAWTGPFNAATNSCRYYSAREYNNSVGIIERARQFRRRMELMK